jgi:hypothetical protein
VIGILVAALLALAGGAAAASRGVLTIGIPTDVHTLDPTMTPEVAD